MKQQQINDCPCGAVRLFKKCCGRYLFETKDVTDRAANNSTSRTTGGSTSAGQCYPDTAEALMRSRYSAYVLCDERYLFLSWHSSTRPDTILLDQVQTKWVDLAVINTINGKSGDSEGVVEFVARYKSNGKMIKLHEVSRFTREFGHWVYLDPMPI